MSLLEGIRVLRWFRCDIVSNTLEIHGFAEASERAYAAMMYLRVCLAEQTPISLVMAKTKVAPLRRVSLPRLELGAVTLLAKLSEHMRSTLGLDSVPVFHWTDSMVVLGWIHGHSARWTTFVANRVAEIHRMAHNVSCGHVQGRDNPLTVPPERFLQENWSTILFGGTAQTF